MQAILVNNKSDHFKIIRHSQKDDMKKEIQRLMPKSAHNSQIIMLKN